MEIARMKSCRVCLLEMEVKEALVEYVRRNMGDAAPNETFDGGVTDVEINENGCSFVEFGVTEELTTIDTKKKTPDTIYESRTGH